MTNTSRILLYSTVALIGAVALLILTVSTVDATGAASSRAAKTSGHLTRAVTTKQSPVRAQPRKKAPTTIRFSGAIGRAQLITDTTLKIVDGGGEFKFLKDEISLSERYALKFQWTTEKANAANGRWEVKNVNAGNEIVANGVSAPAPEPGRLQRFTIPAEAFLGATLPAVNTKYEITIRPYDGANAAVGAASKAVVVTQLSADNVPPPTVFDDGANFPSVEIISYKERVGQVSLTQIFFAYADVKLRVSNKTSINLKAVTKKKATSGSSFGVSLQTGRTTEAISQGMSTAPRAMSSRTNKKTDPMWLNVKDQSLLFRQNAPVSVPELNPGQSIDVDVRLDAILPPPQSQTPQARQHREWRRSYADRCGPELRGVLDWRGNQSQTPLDAHRESLLAAPGWAEYTTTPPSVRICDGNQCVKLCDMEKSIRAQLDGHAVGYGYVVGGQSPKFGGGGKARTSANGTAINFTSKTRVTVASVSKWVTAIATMRILDRNNVGLNDPIGPFFPSNWNVGAYFQNVTFAQLLSQSSGIKDYGNVTQTYARLQSFFTQAVNNNSTAKCTPAGVIDPPNAVTPNDMGRCYSNYNFAILRLLLPRVAGLAEDSNLATRPQTLANQYEQLVQQNVFDRVGQDGPGCRPIGGAHAFAYKYPGDQSGYDWGDVRLRCGAAGWYLSAEDMAKVLFSLNAKDERILAESATETSFNDMRTRGYGLDNFSETFMEKNGGWGANGALVTTSAAIFGPVSGPNVIAVLFINSDISGGPSESARAVLIKAYNDSLKPK